MPLPRLSLRRLAVSCLAGAVALAVIVAETPRLQAQGAAQAAAAQPSQGTETHVYDASLRGIRAATVTLTGQQSASAYSARMAIETTGLGATIRRVRFTAEAQGAVRSGRYAPSRYSEDADTGKRQSTSILEYRRGVPTVVAYRSENDHRPQTVDPATQGGTLDPMTSLWAVMRDASATSACTAAVVTFDGRRRSQTVLSNPQRVGDTVTCTGEYRRLEGFSDKDMAEKARFPFTLSYTAQPDGHLRVTEVAIDTLYGKALLKRR